MKKLFRRLANLEARLNDDGVCHCLLKEPQSSPFWSEDAILESQELAPIEVPFRGCGRHMPLVIIQVIRKPFAESFPKQLGSDLSLS
jgi:hypothetical protein